MNFVHVNGGSLYIDWHMVVDVGRNVLHHVKREGEMSGGICPSGEMSGSHQLAIGLSLSDTHLRHTSS